MAEVPLRLFLFLPQLQTNLGMLFIPCWARILSHADRIINLAWHRQGGGLTQGLLSCPYKIGEQVQHRHIETYVNIMICALQERFFIVI